MNHLKRKTIFTNILDSKFYGLKINKKSDSNRTTNFCGNRTTNIGMRGTESDFINNSLNELETCFQHFTNGNKPTFRGTAGNMLLRSIKDVFQPSANCAFVIPLSPAEKYFTSNLRVLRVGHTFSNIMVMTKSN